MQNRKISIFATFGDHLGFLRKMKSVNISKTVRDRAISNEYLTRRVVQECPMRNRNVKTIRDRVILSNYPQGNTRVSYAKGKKFQEYPMQRGKISIFATFDGHLGF